MALINPVPRWIPSWGSNQLPKKAPKIPMRMSPMSSKPVPCTIWPASQPATRPTNNMTNRLSLDMCIW